MMKTFMLPLSHDEVVHGKSPMIYKMPGDEWQKFANLRLLYTYMFTHPGAKLLFMGNEIAQTSEWDYNKEVAWYLLQYEPHKKMQDFIIDLNSFLRDHSALYELQFSKDGFEWIDLNHRNESVAVFLRKGKKKKENVLVVFNMTPVVRKDWKIQVYGKKEWAIVFNSDEKKYWGTGQFENQVITTTAVDKKDKLYEINISLPALCGIALK